MDEQVSASRPSTVLHASMVARAVAAFTNAVVAFFAALLLTMPLDPLAHRAFPERTADDIDGLLGLALIAAWILVAGAANTIGVGKRASTIGARLLGLQVVGKDFLPIGYRRAFARWVASVASLGIGALAGRYDPYFQAWHDRMVDAIVVLTGTPPALERPEEFAFRWRSREAGGEYFADFLAYDELGVAQQMFLDELQTRLDEAAPPGLDPAHAEAELYELGDARILEVNLTHRADPELVAGATVADTDAEIGAAGIVARVGLQDPIRQPGRPWTSLAVDHLMTLIKGRFEFAWEHRAGRPTALRITHRDERGRQTGSVLHRSLKGIAIAGPFAQPDVEERTISFMDGAET